MMKLKLPLLQQKETAALEELSRTLSSYPEVLRIVVFGSRVRGDFKGASDLDVLLVLEDIQSKSRIIGCLHDIELEYDVPLFPVIFTKQEYARNKELGSGFVERVEREGILLYDFKCRR